MSSQQSTGTVPVRIPQWTVGDRLRKAREEAEIGVEELATMLGRNRNSITRYERSHTVDLMIVRAYAVFTKTPVAWLLSGSIPEDGDDGGVNAAVTLCKPRDIRWGNRGKPSLKLAA